VRPMFISVTACQIIIIMRIIIQMENHKKKPSYLQCDFNDLNTTRIWFDTFEDDFQTSKYLWSRWKSFDSNVKVGQGNKTAVLLLIFRRLFVNPATNPAFSYIYRSFDLQKNIPPLLLFTEYYNWYFNWVLMYEFGELCQIPLMHYLQKI
jgi:hypothetical protein